MAYRSRKHKRRVRPRFWLILFCVLSVALLTAFFRYTRLYNSYSAEANEIRAQRNEAAIVNAQLKRRLEFARSSEFVEREARRQYGLILPGEIRFEADVSSYSGVVAAWNNEETVTTISPFAQKKE